MNKFILIFFIISFTSLHSMANDDLLKKDSVLEYKGKQFVIQESLINENNNTGKLILKRDISSWQYETLVLESLESESRYNFVTEKTETHYTLKTKILGLASLATVGYSAYQYFKK